MVGTRNACEILIGKSQGKKALGKPRHRWKDNVKMAVTEPGFEYTNRIELTQYKVQK
jgi:hypothetical protein